VIAPLNFNRGLMPPNGEIEMYAAAHFQNIKLTEATAFLDLNSVPFHINFKAVDGGFNYGSVCFHLENKELAAALVKAINGVLESFNTVRASDSVSVDVPLDGAVDIPADTVMLMAPLTITPVSDGVLPAEPSHVPMPPVKPTRGQRPAPETDAAYRHRIINAADPADEDIDAINIASGAELDKLGESHFVQRKGI
jgi:hypothetical protein